MAWTQDDIDNLRTLIATGAQEVEYADKKLKLRSLAEMRNLIAEMEAEVNGSGQRTRTKYAQVRGGFYPNSR